jgi:penicillin-binding protein 1A
MRAVVTEGTGQAANLSVPAFGKTGTSQNYRDAYFIGFVGDLVIGVWVGNDDNSPMRKVVGGMLPAQIWRQVMQSAVQRNLVHVAPLLDQPLPASAGSSVESAQAAEEDAPVESEGPDVAAPPPAIPLVRSRPSASPRDEPRRTEPTLVAPPMPIRGDKSGESDGEG